MRPVQSWAPPPTGRLSGPALKGQFTGRLVAAGLGSGQGAQPAEPAFPFGSGSPNDNRLGQVSYSAPSEWTLGSSRLG